MPDRFKSPALQRIPSPSTRWGTWYSTLFGRSLRVPHPIAHCSVPPTYARFHYIYPAFLLYDIMLTRKQQWLRVKPRRNKKTRTNVPAASATMGIAKIESPTSTSSSISTWTSFNSVSDSADNIGKKAVDALPPSSAPNIRAKGVTFEPMVQVCLVTHKSEIDDR